MIALPFGNINLVRDVTRYFQLIQGLFRDDRGPACGDVLEITINISYFLDDIQVLLQICTCTLRSLLRDSGSHVASTNRVFSSTHRLNPNTGLPRPLILDLTEKN